MRKSWIIGAVLAVSWPLPSSASAQAATLLGTVLRDSAGEALGGAEVTIAGSSQRTVTNYQGGFRVNALPAGRYVLTIPHVGFAPLVDTVVLASGQRLEREYVMIAQPVALDSVRVTAPERKYISPNLNAFEERRKSGRGGYFITDSLLRANDDRRLGGVIAGHVSGLALVSKGASDYLASTRKCGPGPTLLTCGAGLTCWVAVYIDGIRIYDASMDVYGRGSPQRPDFARLNARDYAGVEFYAGGASTPIQYTSTGSDCGTLLLWTRER